MSVHVPGQRIRLLYVVGNFVTGGAERHLLEMWRRIDRRQFDLRIACLEHRGAFAKSVEALGWPITDLEVNRLYDFSGLRGLLRLVSLIRDFRPDIVHGYLFSPNFLAALAGRLCGVRAVIVAKRNVDAFESPRQIAVQRLAHRWATHVTAVSVAAADSSVALGVPRSRVTVIENGVDVDRFDGRTHERANGLPVDTAPLIGSVGCLAARKDYGTLLEALAIVKRSGRPFHAAIAGDGPERDALESRRVSLGLDEVTLLGERTDVDQLLPAFDLFVLSSREEGIPNALLEAMAAGRPSVVTDVGGNREVLADGRTGWLVPAQDPVALAAALTQALDDPAESARRGRAARAAMIAERSVEAMVRRHEEYYRRVLGREAADAPPPPPGDAR